MRTALQALWQEDCGQDIIEYTLLIAFITFATVALFVLGMGGQLKAIWVTGNSSLALANTAAS